MGTLARLKAEKERLQNEGSRKVFVSSSTVHAFRVAHENKELLSKEYPLILAVPPGSSSPNSLPLIDASVGPSLRWSLSSVNHVLRTASKYGEPTYIFAGILDNDPQAFVAVTLRKNTPDDELEHLEAVIGRVSQLHIAEKKPMQVPDAGQVVSALGKGLMQVLGVSSGSSHKREREQAREQAREQQQQQREEEQRRSAADRVAYLSGCAGVSTAGTDAVRVAVHGRPVPQEESSYEPSAPYALSAGDYHDPSSLRQQRAGGNAGPMGVTSKDAANDRLAALEAELAREGAPPSAPDIHASPEDTTSSGLYTPSNNPTAPAAAATPGGYYKQQQQQHYEKPWEQHAPGTLSNPYTTAPAPARQHYPSIRSAGENDNFGYDGSSSSSGRPQGGSRPHVKYAQVPGGYKDVPPSGPGGYDTVDYGRAKPWGESGAVASELEQQLQDEAKQARLEWEAEQREAEWQRQQQATRGARYGANDDGDYGGWGVSGSRDQGRKQQQQQQKEKQAPDWLDLLGKVFGGGPAYGVSAPEAVAATAQLL